MTAGANELNQSQKGRIGERITGAAIEGFGWSANRDPTEGYDIVLKKGKTVLFCQVKAAEEKKGKSLRFNCSVPGGKGKRLPCPEDYDILALVSLANRRVFFMPVEDIDKHILTLNPNIFKACFEETSFYQSTDHAVQQRKKEEAQPYEEDGVITVESR